MFFSKDTGEMFSVILLNAGELSLSLAEMKGKSFFIRVVAAGAVLSCVSCDKAKELVESATDKVKELQAEKTDHIDGELVREVTTVNETEGKSIIMSERRLVVVEFYSDT